MTTKRRKKSPLRKLGNMPVRTATQRRDEAIARAYGRGVHKDDIAAKYDLSPATVGAIVWRAGGRSLRA